MLLFLLVNIAAVITLSVHGKTFGTPIARQRKIIEALQEQSDDVFEQRVQMAMSYDALTLSQSALVLYAYSCGFLGTLVVQKQLSTLARVQAVCLLLVSKWIDLVHSLLHSFSLTGKDEQLDTLRSIVHDLIKRRDAQIVVLSVLTLFQVDARHAALALLVRELPSLLRAIIMALAITAPAISVPAVIYECILPESGVNATGNATDLLSAACDLLAIPFEAALVANSLSRLSGAKRLVLIGNIISLYIFSFYIWRRSRDLSGLGDVMGSVKALIEKVLLGSSKAKKSSRRRKKSKKPISYSARKDKSVSSS